MSAQKRHVVRREHVAQLDDERVARTRQKLVDAFHQCLAEGEPLTTSLVSRTAGLGRSTFYTHFASLEELGLYAIDEALAQYATEDLVLREEGRTSRHEIARKGLTDLWEAVAHNASALQHADSAITREALTVRLGEHFSRVLEPPILLEIPDADEDFLAMAMAYVGIGAALTLLARLDAGDKTPTIWVENMLRLVPVWLTTDRS